MHAIDIYKWIGVSGNRFKRQFQDQEDLYRQAKSFWNTIDSNAMIIIGIFLILGILFAYLYYSPYNNKPHRHYHPKHWFWGLICTSVSSLLVSLAILLIMAPARLHGAFLLELKISFANLFYSAIIYFAMSIVWCNCLPTNAYRMFKIKKQS